jgi:hypothetical protein
MVGAILMADIDNWIQRWIVPYCLVCFTVVLTLLRSVDPQLMWSYSSRELPYSFIWFWLNPVNWGEMNYKLFILIFQFVVMIPMVWLVKKGRLSKYAVYLYLATAIYYRTAAVFQEITPTVFLPFVAINPAFIALFVVQKLLPFSTLSVQNPGWQCFFGSTCGAFAGTRLEVTHQDFWADLSYLWWMIVPSIVWLKRRRGWEKTREDKFWKYAGLVLVAILVTGFIVMLVFPFKYSWCAPGVSATVPECP